MAKISKVEAHFSRKITEREKLAKKMQRLETISNAVGSGLIARAVITSSLSIPAFASGWTLPIGVALCLENAASQKGCLPTQTYTALMLLHKMLLMLLIQDKNILSAEFHKILQEMENYRE